MSANKALDFRAYQNARNVINQVTNSRMSKARNWKHVSLGYEQILFYMETFRSGYSGMVRSTVNDHFERGCGDCIADGTGLSHTLAKARLQKCLYLQRDGVRSDDNSHADRDQWTCIRSTFCRSQELRRNYNGVMVFTPYLRLQRKNFPGENLKTGSEQFGFFSGT